MKLPSTPILLVLLALAWALVSTLDYHDARKAECGAKLQDYNWRSDKCLEGVKNAK